MGEIDIDFEGKSGYNTNSSSNNTTQQTNNVVENTTDLNGGGTADITGKDNMTVNNSNNTAETTVENKEGNNNNVDNNSQDDNTSTGELNVGDHVEFDGNTYIVAENGDLVDENNKVFKKADEIKDWLNSLEQEENNGIDLDGIQAAVGVEIVGEDGNPMEFTNDPAGVNAYVNAVIDLKSKELQEGAVNKLYADNPILKQFQDYVTVNGTHRGFGELPDRTGWVVDKDNENQQEVIVKIAAAEFGNKGINENYIKYLKDTGSLYEEAVNQLSALQEKDKLVRKEIEARAVAAREQEQQELEDYWNKVNDVINGRTIAGYKLPESFIKEVNGKKQTVTPRDFYDYLSKQTEVDADGNRMTGYQKDLNSESEEAFMARELITAWLFFTGGTYKDLGDMAIKEEAVRTLKLKSKEHRAHKTIKVSKPNTKASKDDILLG
jgi:hypothetical protein